MCRPDTDYAHLMETPASNRAWAREHGLDCAECGHGDPRAMAAAGCECCALAIGPAPETFCSGCAAGLEHGLHDGMLNPALVTLR